jgi:hypothetical protein
MTEGTFPPCSTAHTDRARTLSPTQPHLSQLPFAAGRFCTVAAHGAGNIVHLLRYRPTSSYIHVFMCGGAKSELEVLRTTKRAEGKEGAGRSESQNRRESPLLVSIVAWEFTFSSGGLQWISRLGKVRSRSCCALCTKSPRRFPYTHPAPKTIHD